MVWVMGLISFGLRWWPRLKHWASFSEANQMPTSSVKDNRCVFVYSATTPEVSPRLHDGKTVRKSPHLTFAMKVSCKFSRIPIHWVTADEATGLKPNLIKNGPASPWCQGGHPSRGCSLKPKSHGHRASPYQTKGGLTMDRIMIKPI